MCEEFNARKYEDTALLALADALVGDLGRVKAAGELGVNYRTLVKCLDSRQVTRIMRDALKEFGNAKPAVSMPPAATDGVDPVVGPVVGPDEEEGGILAQRVADLDAENQQLTETVETQTAHLEDLRRWMGALEQSKRRSGLLGWLSRFGRGRGEGNTIRRHQDPPKEGVVTPEHRLDEERALGPAAPLVAEWREASWTEDTSEDPVEKAEAKVNRLELESELCDDFGLTLPPATEPWDDSTRPVQFIRIVVELRKAHDDLEMAKRARARARCLVLQSHILAEVS